MFRKLRSYGEKLMIAENISRRGFLRGMGLGSLWLALGNFATPAKAGDWTRNLHDETRLLMDTIVRITVSHPSRDQAEQGIGLAFAEMERLISIFDRHRGGTAISILNSQGVLADAPPELLFVLDAAQDYNRLTKQAFDITVQPVLDLFARNANPKGHLHMDQAELDAALALVDMEQVRVQGDKINLGRTGMGLTLDGIAKGYIVDQTAKTLENHGLYNYVINAGGDIRVNGEKGPGKAWTVAVEDPAKTGNDPAVINMRSGAIATSGVYERYFDKDRRHNHLLLPTTGQSPLDRLSVTVKAPTTMQADVLGTALAIMPQTDGLRLIDSIPDCACLIVDMSGQTRVSANWGQV
jgi:thiamine biosynthesis lipoprotein